MDIKANPFYILFASPRDNRRRILELADERSLQLDPSECARARSDLTNPRKRLSAEVAWLPGVGLKRAAEALSLLEHSPADLISIIELTPIARANILAAGLARLSGYTPGKAVEWILEIAWAFENIDPKELGMNINEERVVSGFPEVTDFSVLEAEIQERRLHYRQIIMDALDNLSDKERAEAVTVAVASATNDGEEHGPILIADLVNSYEVRNQASLEKGEENIKILVEKLQAALDAERPDSTLAPMVSQLIQVVKDWDTVAQPIQVSTKSRGLDHDASHRVAGLVRGLAIHMFNEHNKLEFSQQLTNMLQEVFAEVVEVVERADEDADTLEEIAGRIRLSHLLDPISELCKATLENVEKNPSVADKEAQKIIDSAPRLVAELAASKPSAEIFARGKDVLAAALMHCAVAYANKTKKWNSCIFFLKEALKYATSQELKSRIHKNLETTKANERLYGGFKSTLPAPSPYYTVRENNRGDYTVRENNRGDHTVRENNRGDRVGKWVLGIIAVVFLIWLANQAPSVTQSDELQYRKPSVGTNNILSVSEIRWCIREGVRIEAMRDIIDTKQGIYEFNRIVDDYNSYCGSYRYRPGSQRRAERDVAAYQSQIVSEAIRDARQLDRSYR